MAGTKDGGQKAAATNKAKHGSDFYARIGAKGGRNGRTGGFAANRDLARIAGAKGGRISRRRKASTTKKATA
jgi:general stress protein YciG